MKPITFPSKGIKGDRLEHERGTETMQDFLKKCNTFLPGLSGNYF